MYTKYLDNYLQSGLLLFIFNAALAEKGDISQTDQCQYFTLDEAKRERDQLRQTFVSLFQELRNLLEGTESSVSSFCDDFLGHISCTIKTEHSKFFKDHIEDFYKTSGFMTLFGRFALYWDYLNYNLLEYFIEQKGNERLRHKMKLYSETVTEFQRKMRLKVFWEMETKLVENPPPGFRIMVIKHSITSQSTLKDLADIRLKVANDYNLEKFALILHSVVDGSVLTTWFVHESIVDLLLTGLSTQKLKTALHLSSVTIADDG